MTSNLRSAKGVSGKFTATALDRQWQRWKGSYARFIDALDTREVPYLSYSKVSTVERCPQCYLNQYVLRQQPSSNALTTGTLFHKAAEAFYDALCSGQPLGAPTVARLLHPKHTDRAEQAHLDNAIKVMMQNAWEGYDIVATEEVIFLDLAPRLPPVIGVADLILRKDGARRLHRGLIRRPESRPGHLWRACPQPICPGLEKASPPCGVRIGWHRRLSVEMCPMWHYLAEVGCL